MKKIAFVIEHLYGGGAERVTAALANELCAGSGMEIHMIVYSQDPDHNFPTDNRIIWHEVQCMKGSRLNRILSRVKLLRNTVKGISPDCVVSLGSPLIVAPLSLAMFGLRIPLILSERNDPKRFPEIKWHRILRMLYYTQCDGIVFQTKQARDYFPAFMVKKSTVICNPITDILPPRYEGKREKRIVNFCRLVPQKNLPLLIHSFADIASHFPEHILQIYGDGPLRQQLEEQIRSCGMANRIFLCGHSDHIYDDIRNAALFVSSSDYEGISNSMLEAIALGVPTICTDCPAGGAREMICNRENGLLVPVADRAALAEAMLQVLNNEKLAAKMSQAGTQLRQTLCVAEIAKEWLDFIDRVIA